LKGERFQKYFGNQLNGSIVEARSVRVAQWLGSSRGAIVPAHQQINWRAARRSWCSGRTKKARAMDLLENWDARAAKHRI
jgi:hypothetical protein